LTDAAYVSRWCLPSRRLLEQLHGLVELLAYVVDQEPKPESGHGTHELDLLEDRSLLGDLDF
jgi:hypothetical protein